MIIVAATILVVLAMISGLHVYWALGGLWPARSEEELVKTVIGSLSTTRMPPRWLTMMVAAMILLAGLVPLAVLFGWLPAWISVYALMISTAVFLLRGAVSYVVPSLGRKMSEPFRTLNLRYYSPLCLLLGFGFAMMLVFA